MKKHQPNRQLRDPTHFRLRKIISIVQIYPTVGVPVVQSVLSGSCCRRMESSAVDVARIYGTSWWCDKRRSRTSTSILIWILANANFNIFVSSRSPMMWRTTARRWWICGCASVENRMDRKLNFFPSPFSLFFAAECEWRFLSFRIDPYIRLMPLLAMNFDDCSAFFSSLFPSQSLSLSVVVPLLMRIFCQQLIDC